MMVTCSICFEPTEEVGEIDSCFHRFCWSCINQWADRESRCPLCKQRFKRIKRKALGVPNSAAEPPRKLRKLDKGGTAAHNTAFADCPKTPPQPGEDGSAAKAPAVDPTAADAAGSADEPASPKGELAGVVLEERKVRAKDQVYMPEDDAEDLQELVDSVHCMVCGADDNDEFLLICDGCDNGYHTYCVNRRTVPLGDWFCPECEEQHGLREEYRQQHRGQRQAGRLQRQQQQGTGQVSTRQTAARAAAGTAAGPGRRRLRRGTSSGAAAAAAGAIDDGIDLTLADSDLESEGEGPGPGRLRRVRGVAGVGTVSDLDDDYELELHDEDDLQDSDWEAEADHTDRRSTRPRSNRRGRNRQRGSSVSGDLAGSRHAAGGSTTARAHADEVHRRLATSAGRAAVMATAGARATASAGRDGVRLKSWQELRAEEEREVAAGSTAGVTGSRGAAEPAAAAGRTRTSMQLVDLMRAVNNERRRSQSQLAAAGAGTDRSRVLSGEEQAWAALNQVRSSAATDQNPRTSSRMTATPLARRSGRSAAASTSATQSPQHRVASAYFSSAGQQQQQQQPAPHGSAAAGDVQQQREAQLRQALLARLQRQRRQRQQQQQAGRQSLNAQLSATDPRDPEYMDIIRGSISAARDKGEEERKRRELADAAAAAALPAGTGAAKRLASGPAVAASAAAHRPAARQPESRLARSMSAAGQREAQLQRRQQSQQLGGWSHNSSSFMDRWLDKGAKSHGPVTNSAAAMVAGSSREDAPQQLPRSVRTLGAVKRGAAAQAAAVAAAGAAGGQPHVAGSSQRQQQQASRQPLQLQPSYRHHQQQQQQWQRQGQPLEDKEHNLQQPYSTSRYFVGAEPAHARQAHQLQSWQHQQMLDHLLPAGQQKHQLQLMVPGVQGQQQSVPAPPPQQQQRYCTGTAVEIQQPCHGLQPGYGVVHDAGQQESAMVPAQQRLLHTLQPVNSNTSNSSETVFMAGAACGSAAGAAPPAAAAAASSGTPCSAWLLALPAAQQHQQQPLAPEQVLHVEQPLEVHQPSAQEDQLHYQQQPVMHQSVLRPCPLQAKPPDLPPAAYPLSYEQLKSAKAAASSIAKARLRPLFQSQMIDKDLYVHAAKLSTHGLYEQVKQGALALQDIMVAAEAADGACSSSSSSKCIAFVMKVVDKMLVSAGVPVDIGD